MLHLFCHVRRRIPVDEADSAAEQANRPCHTIAFPAAQVRKVGEDKIGRVLRVDFDQKVYDRSDITRNMKGDAKVLQLCQPLDTKNADTRKDGRETDEDLGAVRSEREKLPPLVMLLPSWYANVRRRNLV